MKIFKASTRILLGITLLFSGGCFSYHLESVKSGIWAYEGDSLHEFDIVSQTICISLPAPCNWSFVLVLPGTPHSEHGDLVTISQSPRWCQLGPGHTWAGQPPNLLDVADAITKDEPPDRVRWVLGINPVIVGIGSTALKPSANGDYWRLEPVSDVPMLAGLGTTKLVTRDDLDEKLMTLLVCDRWQDGVLRPPTRRIVLKPQTSIAAVFHDRPWENYPPPSTKTILHGTASY